MESGKKCVKFFVACLASVFLAGCGESGESAAADVPISIGNQQGLSSEEWIDYSSGESGVSSESKGENSSDSHGMVSSNSHDLSFSSNSHDLGFSSDSRDLIFSSGREDPKSSEGVRPIEKMPAYLVGADISKFQEYESYGTRIFDTDGTEKDIFSLLKGHGFNAIRLKTFVSPKAPYGYAAAGCGQDSEAFGDKEHLVAYARKVKKAGFVFLLDIHYSDVWADPDTQIIPERWRNISTAEEMADSVYGYTYDLMESLRLEDALPDLVQVGNEITNGMLRDLPTSGTNCWGDNVTLASNSVNGVMNKQQNPDGIAHTAKYLAAGSRAVKSFETASHRIKTVFHIESPQNETTVNWWMNSIIKGEKVSPDVMAFSAYTAYQHGTPDTWKKLLGSLAQGYPDLEFLVAEYNGGSGKNYYGYDGSRAKTHQMMEQIPRGLGAFFWEPASYGEWGTALLDWEGNTLRANPKAFEEYERLKPENITENDK